MGLSFLRAVQKERMKRRRSRRRRPSRRITEMQDSNTWVAPEIPLELLIEIMARLPPKSVMRFKCISKFWSSLFRSRYCCDRFLMVPSRPQPRLYMTLSDDYNRCKPVFLTSAPSTSPSSLVFDKDLTIRGMKGYFLRFLRGFISFTVDLAPRIYNPSTRQLVILPAAASDFIAGKDEYNVLYFIGHDPINDQYKVLCTATLVTDEADMKDIRSEYWVFVLEAGGSWKRKIVAKDFHPHLPHLVELNMNGVLYYLAWIDLLTYVLVSFDIRSEEFNMIQVPRLAGDILPMTWKRLTQLDYGGKVAVFDYTCIKHSGKIDLWILQDWKKKVWSRKTMVLQPSQKHLVTTSLMTAKAATTPKKVIFIPDKLISPYYLLCYDLQTNDLKKVEIKGIPKHWFTRCQEYIDFDMNFMDSSESIRYLET